MCLNEGNLSKEANLFLCEKGEILILHHLLRGQIVIKDHTVNEYIEKHYKDSFGDKLKDVKVFFIDGGLCLCAALKPHRLLPDVMVDINFALDSFDFRPGAHNFNFRFTEKPKLTFPEQRSKVSLRILNFIFEKIVGSKRIIGIVSRKLNEMSFLAWNYDRVTLDLDKHPEAKKLFEKRVPLIGMKIFDFIGVKEILFGKGEVVLKPKIYPDDLVEKLQDIRDLVAAGRERRNTAVNAITKANNLDPRANIYPGQKITIPGQSSTQKLYTVQRGDSLWLIAQKHGTTVADLARLNQINPNNPIYPGQQLKV